MRSKPGSPSLLWAVFFFGGACALYVVFWHFATKPSDRNVGLVGAFLFGSVALLSLGWEVGRKLQTNGALWREMELGGETKRVFLLRASRLQVVFLIAFMFVIGAVCAAIFWTSPGFGSKRWEIGVAGVAGFGLALFFGWTRLRRERGVALVPGGVWWLENGAPLFVPWDAIALTNATRVAQDVGHGFTMKAPALGMRLNPNASLLEGRKNLASPGRRTRAKLEQARNESGYDLTFLAEALVLSPDVIASLIEFFRLNPRHRRELEAGASSLGFLETLLAQAAKF